MLLVILHGLTTQKNRHPFIIPFPKGPGLQIKTNYSEILYWYFPRVYLIRLVCNYFRKLLDNVSLFDYYRTIMKVELVKIFKALSSEQRLNIFKMLYEWQQSDCETMADCSSSDEGMERCFTKACCCMELSRSTISHHFKELENAGLIKCTRSGQSFVCKVNMEAVQAIRDFLK